MANERDNPTEPGGEPRWIGADRSEVRHEAASSPAYPAGAEERRVSERRVVVNDVPDDRRLAVTDRRTDRAAALEQRQHVIGRVTQGVDYLFYLLYGLLGIRFVLGVLGASQSAGFVQFINGLTQPFYAPFAGMVSRPSVNGGFIDFPLIIAVLAYALLHLAVRGLLRFAAGARATP